MLVTWVAIGVATPSGRQPRAAELAGAAVAGLTFAWMITPWTYATQFTPYGLSACFAALLLAAAWAWWKRAGESDHRSGLFVIGLLFGLDFSVHRTNALFIPGAIVWIAARRWSALSRVTTWATLFVGAVAGLAVHLLLIPLAARDPVFSFAEPRDLRAFWSYVSLGPQGGGFLIDLLPRRSDVWSVQLADYARFLQRNLWDLSPIPGGAALLALVGIAAGLRSARRRTLGLLFLWLSGSLGVVLYFNIPERFFRSWDRHYLPSLVVLAPLLGIGATAMLRGVSRLGETGRWLAPLLSAALFLIPVYNWRTNRERCDLSRTPFTETWARDMLEPLPPAAILLTNGDNDTFPLWYLQHVEQVRPDVSVVNVSLLNAAWYVSHLQRHDERFVGWFEGRDSPDPSQGAVRTEVIYLDPRAAEDLPPGSTVPDSVVVSVDARLPEDEVVADLLRHGHWRRPLLLACTMPPSRLAWLRPYARPDGLAFRVVPTTDPDAWDLERHRHQLTSVLRYQGLSDPRTRLDADSRGMCQTYVVALVQLARQQLDRGDRHGCLETLRFLEERLPLARLDVPTDMLRRLRSEAERTTAGN
jgi:hypothetical protein